MTTARMQRDGFYAVRQRARLRAVVNLLREIGAESDWASQPRLGRRQRPVITLGSFEPTSRSA